VQVLEGLQLSDTRAATQAAQLAYVARRKAEYAADVAACGGARPSLSLALSCATPSRSHTLSLPAPGVVLAVASPDLPVGLGTVVSVRHRRAILQVPSYPHICAMVGVPILQAR